MSSPRNNNVIVLAAGRGARLAAAGVTVPKPLVEFRGRRLLELSVDVAHELRRGSGRVVVVATPGVAQAAAGLAPEAEFVVARFTQPGPAASAMLALGLVDPEEPVTVMDCDNYYPAEHRSWTDEIPVGRDFMTGFKLPAGASAAEYCTLHTSADELTVSYVTEKNAEGPWVGTGVYGFHRARRLRWAYCSLLGSYPDDLPGLQLEIPMSEVVMRRKTLGHNTSVALVQAEAWTPLGTPAQFEAAGERCAQSPTSRE